MPSNSLTRWSGERADALDEIEHAHLQVGGSERGRRFATLQINHAYVTLLSSQFQGFCRDLHSESLDHIVGLVPPQMQTFLRAEFLFSRSLDRHNPQPGAIGSDFNRLGIEFWTEIHAMGARNQRRREILEELNRWRNAIAHQDFDAVGGNQTLHLARVRRWRRAIGALADNFDRAMYHYLRGLLGAAPW
jgi:hypothetical protein